LHFLKSSGLQKAGSGPYWDLLDLLAHGKLSRSTTRQPRVEDPPPRSQPHVHCFTALEASSPKHEGWAPITSAEPAAFRTHNPKPIDADITVKNSTPSQKCQRKIDRVLEIVEISRLFPKLHKNGGFFFCSFCCLSAAAGAPTAAAAHYKAANLTPDTPMGL